MSKLIRSKLFFGFIYNMLDETSTDKISFFMGASMSPLEQFEEELEKNHLSQHIYRQLPPLGLYNNICCYDALDST